MKYITTVGEKEFTIELLDDRRVRVDGIVHEVDFAEVESHKAFTLLVDGQSYEAHIDTSEEDLQVLLLGTRYSVTVEDERERRLRAASLSTVVDKGEYRLKAPMPGLVVTMLVITGQAVQKGDVLVILESMKMQNELKSPRDGVVSRVNVQAGDSVEQKQTLLSLE